MKTFSYTATDKDWALKRGVLQAEDRIAALAELRKRGLTPVSVTEGRAPRAARGRVVATAVCGALALLALGGGLWLARQRGRPAAVPAPATAARSAPRAAPPAAAARVPETESPAAPSRGPVAAAAAPAAPAAAPAVSAPPRKRPALKRPARVVEAVPGLATNAPPPHGYSSATELVINMIVNTRPGAVPPPLLRLPPHENIAEILERDIAVYDEDSPRTVEEKANVAYAKQLLKEYLAQGGDPEAFLVHYHGTLKQAFEERQAAQKYTMELIRAGDKKGAEEYMTRKNAELGERGIMPVQIPAFMR